MGNAVRHTKLALFCCILIKWTSFCSLEVHYKWAALYYSGCWELKMLKCQLFQLGVPLTSQMKQIFKTEGILSRVCPWCCFVCKTTFRTTRILASPSRFTPIKSKWPHQVAYRWHARNIWHNSASCTSSNRSEPSHFELLQSYVSLVGKFATLREGAKTA